MSPQPWLKRQTWQRLFELDLRALAAMRLATAAVLLFDLCVRASDLKLFYSDSGPITQELYAAYAQQSWWISIYRLHGSLEWATLVMAISILAALLLAVGYRTRWVTVLCWYLLISLDARNRLVVFGADAVLRLLLFWCMFLPWGERLSIDGWLARRRNQTTAGPNRVSSPATAAYLLQIVYIYLFTALLKTGEAWRTDFTALAFALQHDQFVSRLGEWLSQHFVLTQMLTTFTFWLEACGWLLLFIPYYRSICRWLFIFSHSLLHVGIITFMAISFFPVINIVALIGLVPTQAPPWKSLPLAEPLSGAPCARAWQQPLHYLPLMLSAVVLLWNVEGLWSQPIQLPKAVKEFGYTLRIDQKWAMFAPTPARDDGWWILQGRLKNGADIDLFVDGQPLNWTKPESISALYKNVRRRKFFHNLRKPYYDSFARRFLAYECQQWNQVHQGAEQLETLKLIFMLEFTGDDLKPQPVEMQLLTAIACAQPNVSTVERPLPGRKKKWFFGK